MMAVATTTPAGEPQAFGLPLLTRLLPGLVSAIALLPASLALEFSGLGRVLLPLLIAQGSLLALGAGLLAVSAHDRLRQWESRAAPLGARDRVRRALLGDLWRMAAIGAGGPLALALVLAWRGDGWGPVCAALAMPAACVCSGLVAALGWHGRAPRLLLVPALAVLAVLLGLPGGGLPGTGGGWLLAVAAAVAALLWRWLASRRALAVVAPPLPWPRPMAWVRRTTVYQAWRVTSVLDPRAPFRNGSERYRLVGVLLSLWGVLQLVGQADRLRWFSWGRAYEDAYDVANYGGCMLLITLVAAGCYVAPPLHWRLRLAPRGMSPQGWAVRMVLGSMGAAVGLVAVALALVVLFRASDRHDVNAGTWLSLTGDVLLASSFLRWQQSRRWPVWIGALMALAVPALPALVLYGLVWLGLTPQRGLIWLALQLALAVPLTVAAIRAWSRRDLNELS